VRVEGLALTRGNERHRHRLRIPLLLEERVEIARPNVPQEA